MGDLVDSIKKIALASVLEPDRDAIERKVRRWYSKQFYTPLPEVEDLPLDYILLHYFEDLYESLDRDDLVSQIPLVLETPEERKLREEREQADEDAYMAKVAQELKEDDKKLLNKKPLKTKPQEEPIETPDEEEVKIEIIDEATLNDLLDS